MIQQYEHDNNEYGLPRFAYVTNRSLIGCQTNHEYGVCQLTTSNTTLAMVCQTNTVCVNKPLSNVTNCELAFPLDDAPALR